MLQFDSNGHLFPHRSIDGSLDLLHEFFVEPFDDSPIRHLLFETFKSYEADLKNQLNSPFFQLIDGSFVTQK